MKIYESGILDNGQTAVLEELGRYIPEVPVEDFIHNYLPPIDIDINEILKKLHEDAHISQEGTWSSFPIDPAKSKKTETVVFKPFKGILDKITKYISKDLDLSQTLEFVDNPSKAPFAERGNLTWPDGYGRLKDKKIIRVPENTERAKKPVRRAGRLASAQTLRNKNTKEKDTSPNPVSADHWDDICIPFEFKKNNTDADVADNTCKIVWSMQHIMSNDPCRRFVLGLTIESTSMRIWYADRSKVFVTLPFNFRREPATLISIFASLSFAREVDLGWDPSIQRILVDGKICYEIVVHEKRYEKIVERVYRTFKVVSDVGAIGLRGRGTRVFLAHLLDENGKVVRDPVALKDAWVDVTRLREGQIREALLEAANEQDRKVLEMHIMTVLDSGDVLIDGKPDNTHEMLRDLSLPDRATFCLQPTAPPPRKTYLGEGESSQRDYAFQRAPHSPHRTYPDKVHHRVVFKEIGTTIDVLPNLKDVRVVLVDIIKVLQVCHKYSRVHRDISTGNVYLFEGRGLLGDLEYMKEIGQETENEVRTGTLDFMAIEIDSYRYMFRRRLDDENPLVVPKSPPFHYNPLHDLESIWWVGVRTIFTCGVDGVDDSLASEEQKRNASLLFPRALGVVSRIIVMSDDVFFVERARTLFKSFHSFASALERYRRLLVQQYRQAELGSDIDTTAFIGVHAQFIKFLLEAEVDVPLVLPGVARKRPREGDVDVVFESAEAGPSSKKAEVDVPLFLPGVARKRPREGDVDVVFESAEAGPSSKKIKRI